jgi:hypothetical protein
MIAGSKDRNYGRDRAVHALLVVLLAAVALAPFVHLVITLVANYYSALYYDSWSSFYHLAEYMRGNSGLGEYLFSQQNEARPAFPRLLLLLVHKVTRDLTIDVVLNVSSAVGTAVVTLLLLRKTNRDMSRVGLLAGAILFNLTFFSLAQCENWNWRNQLIMLLPNFFLALGWLINLSSLRPLRRAFLISLCSAAATFSFANGMFQWFLVPPLTFGLERKIKLRVWGLHAGAALLCLFIYFRDYGRPGGHDPVSTLAFPGRIAVYYFTWLGSSLSSGALPVAIAWGGLLFLTFLVLICQCAMRWRNEGLQTAWLPWVSMGCYALISGGVTALSRSHIGLEQALRPRYCTISQWLIVSIIGLGATLLQQSGAQGNPQTKRKTAFMALLAACFLCSHARHDSYAATEWAAFAERMRFEKQSFGLEESNPGQLWTFDHPDRHLVLTAYAEMRQLGFFGDCFHSSRILPLLAGHETGRWNDGEVSLATCLPFREMTCRGWSIGGDAAAGNRVLVVLLMPTGKVLAVGDGPIDRIRRDILRYGKPFSPALAGFDLQFQIPKLEPGVYSLAAFRYGKDERSYHPLGAPKEFEIRK